jgi:hypothetical protein
MSLFITSSYDTAIFDIISQNPSNVLYVSFLKEKRALLSD